MIFFGALASLVVIVRGAPAAPCTEATPCRPDGVIGVLVGLVVGAALVAFVHLWLAALALLPITLVLIGYDVLHPGSTSPVWAQVSLAGCAAWCVAWAKLGSDQRRRAVCPVWPADPAPPWLSVAAGVKPPMPDPPPRRGWLAATLAATLILGALAGAAWGSYRQVRANTQQAAARVVTAAVLSHPDEFTVRVSYPDHPATDIGVIAAADYPVGSAVRLAVDERGLHQPLSEPYDALTYWFLLAAMLALPGAGIWLSARGAPPRRFFRRAQPVSAVQVRRGPGRVLIFAGDASAGDLPFAEIPVLGGPDAFHTYGDTSWMVSPPRPATLYGVPMIGRWCTVTVGRITLTPRKPAKATLDSVPFGAAPSNGVPYGAIPFNGAPVTTVPAYGLESATARTDGFPPGAYAGEGTVGVVTSGQVLGGERAEQPSAATGERPLTHDELWRLRPEDVTAPPEQTRVYRMHRLPAYLVTVSLPLVVASLLRLFAHLTAGWGLFGIVAACVGLGYWIGWRLWFLPMVAWNGGGIAVRGSFGRRIVSLPWADVTAIRRDGTLVILQTRVGTHVVPGQGRWAPGLDATRLALTLRHARARAYPTIEPPLPVGRARWGDAVALWLIGLIMTIGLGQFALLSEAVLGFD